MKSQIRLFPMIAVALMGTIGSLKTASAAGKPAQCLLVVRDKTLINGPCNFHPTSGGSFMITHNNGYFADVRIVDFGVARGNFNGFSKNAHAHDDLGVLKKNSACWSNEQAIICAW